MSDQNVTGRGTRIDDFYAEVTYSYRVGGDEYQSDRIAPPFYFEKLDLSQERMREKYERGDMFGVYYNADKPSEAYFLYNRKNLGVMKGIAIIGGVLTCLMLSVAGVVWLRTRSAASAM